MSAPVFVLDVVVFVVVAVAVALVSRLFGALRPDDGLALVSQGRIRHRARGSVYEVMGYAKLQVSEWSPNEGDTLVIYRGPDGQLWAREENETFQHGRFEVLP